MEFIKKLKTKPKHVRDQVAFFFALGFTGMIALVWLVALPDRINQFSAISGGDESVVETKSSIKQVLGDFKGQLGSIISGLKEGVRSPSLEPDGGDTNQLPDGSAGGLTTDTSSPSNQQNLLGTSSLNIDTINSDMAAPKSTEAESARVSEDVILIATTSAKAPLSTTTTP